MLVLKIIGALVAIFLVYLFVIWINGYTDKKYKYEFFNLGNYFVSALGYVLIYYGHDWYVSALEKNLDILNGQLIMGFGVMLLAGVVYYNIKNTSLSTGLALSVVQLLLYSVLAVVGFLALIMAIGYFSQTKPVYNVND